MTLRNLALLVYIVDLDEADCVTSPPIRLRVELRRSVRRVHRFWWRAYLHEEYVLRGPQDTDSVVGTLFTTFRAISAPAGHLLESRLVADAPGQVLDDLLSKITGWGCQFGMDRLPGDNSVEAAMTDSTSIRHYWLVERMFDMQLSKHWEVRLEVSRSSSDEGLFRWRVLLLDIFDLEVAFNPRGMIATEKAWVDISDTVVVTAYSISTPNRCFRARDVPHATHLALELVRTWADDHRDAISRELTRRPRRGPPTELG